MLLFRPLSLSPHPPAVCSQQGMETVPPTCPVRPPWPQMLALLLPLNSTPLMDGVQLKSPGGTLSQGLVLDHCHVQ